MDSRYRSIAKAVSYRVLGSLCTAIIFLILTHKPMISVGAGVLDFVAKAILYFLHERLWNRIEFGRQKPPEYEI